MQALSLSQRRASGYACCSRPVSPSVYAIPCRSLRSYASQPRRLVVRNAEGTSVAVSDKPITLTEEALKHLKKLRAEIGDDSLFLRVGVKQGGCSGMSYQMDFEKESNIASDDYVIQYEDFRLICNPKSMLYLFGMKLDYSGALIGGGFQFQNPNAVDSCGCGKSFGV